MPPAPSRFHPVEHGCTCRDQAALAVVEPHWDALILRSYISSDGQPTLYPEGSVPGMQHPRDLIRLYGQTDAKKVVGNTAMFCGTFDVIGGIRWSDRFEMELEDPVLGRRLTHSYRVRPLPIAG